MAGTGAIDVPQGSPSVHKGKCVQCHMVPTSYDRNGVPQTGANHVFGILQPEVAAEAHLRPLSPACRSHAALRRAPPATAGRRCLRVRTSRTLLTNRQAAMHGWDDEVSHALGAAAANLGFTGSTDAR